MLILAQLLCLLVCSLLLLVLFLLNACRMSVKCSTGRTESSTLDGRVGGNHGGACCEEQLLGVHTSAAPVPPCLSLLPSPLRLVRQVRPCIQALCHTYESDRDGCRDVDWCGIGPASE